MLTGILSSSLVYSYFLSFMDIGGSFIGKQDNTLQASMRLMDEETKKNVLSSIIIFYKVKSAGEDPVRNIFLEKDRVGYGFVATSDGWVVADKIISAYGIKQIAAVLGDGKVMDILKIEKDAKNNLVFARIDATGLKPVSFGNSRDLMPGENLYLIGGDQRTTKIYFDSIGYKPAVSESSAINSSEIFGKAMFFGEAVNSDFNGLPAVNYRGDVVGIVRGDGANIATAVPSEYVEKSLQSLFKYGKIKHAVLGLKYLDLSRIVSADETFGRRGVLILSADEEKTSLETGDIVLKINNDELSKENNLSEIISDYQMGDELDFDILRSGKEQTIKIKMGE